MRIGFLIAAIAIAALVILGFQYGGKWFGEAPPATVAEPASSDESPAVDARQPLQQPLAAEPEVPQVVLPVLDASDAFVLEQLESFGLPTDWLDREDLLRRLAVVIDNAPRGEYPRSQLGFLAPTGSFKVIRRGDDIFLDPVSYSRYDGYLEILEGVDPELLAATIVLLEPLIAEGLAELGNQRAVSGQIDAAIGRINALQGLGAEVRLVQPEVLYQFADPQLEALSPLHKQALRLGPDNLARLQSYLQQFQQALAARVAGG